MDITTISQLITNLGFPIVCVLGLAWFVYQMFTKVVQQSEDNMVAVQSKCQEREDKLYEEIKANREVNAQAVATIAICTDKLTTIQNDIDEIKVDIVKINEHLNC